MLRDVFRRGLFFALFFALFFVIGCRGLNWMGIGDESTDGAGGGLGGGGGGGVAGVNIITSMMGIQLANMTISPTQLVVTNISSDVDILLLAQELTALDDRNAIYLLAANVILECSSLTICTNSAVIEDRANFWVIRLDNDFLKVFKSENWLFTDSITMNFESLGLVAGNQILVAALKYDNVSTLEREERSVNGFGNIPVAVIIPAPPGPPPPPAPVLNLNALLPLPAVQTGDEITVDVIDGTDILLVCFDNHPELNGATYAQIANVMYNRCSNPAYASALIESETANLYNFTGGIICVKNAKCDDCTGTGCVPVWASPINLNIRGSFVDGLHFTLFSAQFGNRDAISNVTGTAILNRMSELVTVESIYNVAGWEPANWGGGFGEYSLSSGDMNNDGVSDLIGSSYFYTHILSGAAAPNPPLALIRDPSANRTEPRHVVVNYNGNGVSDLIIAYTDWEGIGGGNSCWDLHIDPTTTGGIISAPNKRICNMPRTLDNPILIDDYLIAGVPYHNDSMGAIAAIPLSLFVSAPSYPTVQSLESYNSYIIATGSDGNCFAGREIASTGRPGEFAAPVCVNNQVEANERVYKAFRFQGGTLSELGTFNLPRGLFNTQLGSLKDGKFVVFLMGRTNFDGGGETLNKGYLYLFAYNSSSDRYVQTSAVEFGTNNNFGDNAYEGCADGWCVAEWLGEPVQGNVMGTDAIIVGRLTGLTSLRDEFLLLFPLVDNMVGNAYGIIPPPLVPENNYYGRRIAFIGENDAYMAVAAPTLPDEIGQLVYYQANPVTITDAPVWSCGEEGSGSCYYAKGTKGCADESACLKVCVDYPHCCLFEWDQTCADLAVANWGWTCDPDYYGGDDGCDCGCGLLDPDCAGSSVNSCDYCDDNGSCNVYSCPGIINLEQNWLCSEVPDIEGWTCNPLFYDAGDGCDCGCGILDPDCIDSTVDSCNRCNASGSCERNTCPGYIDVWQNWMCTIPPGSCCQANAVPSCEDEQCAQAVCSIDDNCCNVQWDQSCADYAALLIDCENAGCYTPPPCDESCVACAPGTCTMTGYEDCLAAGLDQWDPDDDSRTGGTPITPAEDLQCHGPHTLISGDYYDYYKLEGLVQGQTYTIDTCGGDCGGSPNIYLEVQIFNSYGNQVSCGSSCGTLAGYHTYGQGSMSCVSFTPDLDPDTYNYYVIVYNYGDTVYKLNYQLGGSCGPRDGCSQTNDSGCSSGEDEGCPECVPGNCTVDDYQNLLNTHDVWDPDDSWSYTQLDPPTTEEQCHGPHSIGVDDGNYSDDYDLFTILLEAGHTYNFNTCGGDCGTSNTTFVVYDEYWNMYEYRNDNYYSSFMSCITFVAPVGGNYYIEVQGLSSSVYNLNYSESSGNCDW